MTGILLVDKPQGFTSHDVIAKLRGILRERRLGHAGTLDPMATGLLVVFAGRATRAVQFAEAHEKRYIAAFRAGITTDTQDITGTVLEKSGRVFTEEELCKLIPEFTGEIEQIPPMYSAIKQDGKKLYELARKGVAVERGSRRITVYSMEYLGRENDDFFLDIRCSKGTYIRTLCHDIGQRLGTGAALSVLRRTASGIFSLEDSHSIGEIAEYVEQGRERELFLPVDTLFADCPEFKANELQRAKCLCGNPFNADVPDGNYRVYDPQGSFLMLGEMNDGVMRTVKSFFEV